MADNQPSFHNLRQFRLFDDLTPEVLRDLLPLLGLRHYHRGEFLFHMGESADRLFFLHQGIVKISRLLPNGEEHILDVFGPGDTFGELSLSDAKWRVGTAQALSEVTVRTMTEVVFNSVARSIPNFCLNAVRHLIDRQRRTLVYIEALTHVKKAGPRLLFILLDLAERYGRRSGDSYQLPVSLTQEDLASLTGLNRSTVSTLINDYRRSGVLGGHGHTLVIQRAPARALLAEAGLGSLD
ncbi:MAG: Crp/Fnr family transcriptional regulator [Ardenticatenaceae bacterium]